MRLMEWVEGEFLISTDPARIRMDQVHDFLSNDSYWAKDRPRELTEKAIDNSLVFGMYFGDQQIGFARIVTDYATIAYIGDVYIHSDFRGRGLSKWLMKTIVEHPELQGFRRYILATKDAHGLYEQFEFFPLRHPERWMEKTAPNAY